MVKTLLITDIHLRSFCPGYLECQITYLTQLIDKERPEQIIIMGDIFMNRRPSPSVLLGFKAFIDFCKRRKIQLYLLRGNHDSETKADDGVTALSLFEDCPGKCSVLVYRNITRDVLPGLGECLFIPHYEYINEDRITLALKDACPEEIVFGHFGFYGSMNSVGDKDFSISPNAFKNETYLGHIHTYGKFNNITVLGTPYTTNFGEIHKTNYYGVFEDAEFILKESTGGIRHIVSPVDMLENEGFQKYVNDSNYATLLRVLYTGLDTITKKDIVALIKEKYPNILYSEVKYTPMVINKGELSTYSPDDVVLSIDEKLIRKYVEQNNTEIPTDTLLESFKKIKDIDNVEYRQN